MEALFTPHQIGGITLRNRIALAPLTRCRASRPDYVPTALMADYYAQRAGGGLLITEGTNVSPLSNAFDGAPGIWTAEQTEGWKPVVGAVHDRGAPIFVQLWHGGRVSNDTILGGEAPLAPSVTDGRDALQVYAIDDDGRSYKVSASIPRAMTVEDIARTVEAFANATANAKAAGFDGVEFHAANGYLLHQFQSAGTNLRDDAYGGSIENRIRLTLEAVDAAAAHLPYARMGIRFSPLAKYNDVGDPDPGPTYTALAKALQSRGLGYIHLGDTNAWMGAPDLPALIAMIRPHYTGTLIVNGGIEAEAAARLVSAGTADVVAFGRQFLANPDLPERIRTGAPLNEQRMEGFYGHAPAEEGYTDYPTLETVA
ncbi:MAG: alkene reductase [Pseudomonadota bacterium]